MSTITISHNPMDFDNPIARVPLLNHQENIYLPYIRTGHVFRPSTVHTSDFTFTSPESGCYMYALFTMPCAFLGHGRWEFLEFRDWLVEQCTTGALYAKIPKESWLSPHALSMGLKAGDMLAVSPVDADGSFSENVFTVVSDDSLSGRIFSWDDDPQVFEPGSRRQMFESLSWQQALHYARCGYGSFSMPIMTSDTAQATIDETVWGDLTGSEWTVEDGYVYPEAIPDPPADTQPPPEYEPPESDPHPYPWAPKPGEAPTSEKAKRDVMDLTRDFFNGR